MKGVGLFETGRWFGNPGAGEYRGTRCRGSQPIAAPPRLITWCCWLPQGRCFLPFPKNSFP